MKLVYLLFAVCFAGASCANPPTYVGSTPAHAVVRSFLGISPTDSIDFIRWNLELEAGSFKLHCRYGLAQPATPGFRNENTVSLDGTIIKAGKYFTLRHKNRDITVLLINPNILHFLGADKEMLPGNGGYSYALNNNMPPSSAEFNFGSKAEEFKHPLVYEGRTPCQELSVLLGLNKGTECNKMKWKITFYTDSVTGQPSYFVKSGTGEGTWQVITKSDGRIIYRLVYEKWAHPLDLLKGDNNVLFFLDAEKRLFTGNEDFSFTLNRQK